MLYQVASFSPSPGQSPAPSHRNPSGDGPPNLPTLAPTGLASSVCTASLPSTLLGRNKLHVSCISARAASRSWAEGLYKACDQEVLWKKQTIGIHWSCSALFHHYVPLLHHVRKYHTCTLQNDNYQEMLAFCASLQRVAPWIPSFPAQPSLKKHERQAR